ncbi:MAG: GH25 family lysozyme [Bacteroidia bacterium]
MIINQHSPSSIIKAWQSFLDSQGFPAGSPDGIWGPNTAQATKDFQQASNLAADGIPGPQTIEAASSKGFSVPEATQFAPAGNLNAVFDISHLNASVDLAKAKAEGMLAVFHKATQSIGANLFHDKTYPDRRKDAQKAGLLWGAYHFGTSGDGKAQADAFLDYAQPDGNTLLVLDFERATTQGETSMTIQEARDFVNQVKARTGKFPGIYGGALLKAATATAADPVLSQCWLWIAEYENEPRLPNGWSTYAFWQFTDGTHGNGALPVDGIGRCDRDLFRGSAVELTSFWAGNGV